MSEYAVQDQTRGTQALQMLPLVHTKLPNSKMKCPVLLLSVVGVTIT